MPDLMPTIVAILRTYMRDANAPIGAATTLIDLDIDQMDLPMISLDIEDAFGVQIGYDDEIDETATVRDLGAGVVAQLNAKAAQRHALAAAPRVKRSWVSTGAERRR